MIVSLYDNYGDSNDVAHVFGDITKFEDQLPTLRQTYNLLLQLTAEEPDIIVINTDDTDLSSISDCHFTSSFIESQQVEDTQVLKVMVRHAPSLDNYKVVVAMPYTCSDNQCRYTVLEAIRILCSFWPSDVLPKQGTAECQ